MTVTMCLYSTLDQRTPSKQTQLGKTAIKHENYKGKVINTNPTCHTYM